MFGQVFAGQIEDSRGGLEQQSKSSASRNDLDVPASGSTLELC